MSWTVLHEPGSFKECYDVWQDVHAAVGGGHPLLDARFLAPCIDIFGEPSRRMAVALLERDRRVEGALLLEHRGLGVWRAFMTPHTPIAPILGMHRMDLASNLRDLVAQLPGPAWLLQLNAHDPFYAAVGASHEGPHVENRSHQTTVRVSIEGSFDDYWQSRSRNLRRSIRGALNRLRTACLDLRFVKLERPAEMAKAIREHSKLEHSGWKKSGDTAMEPRNDCGKFYRGVLDSFAARGQACVYQLFMGDELAASQMTLSQNGMVVLLKTAYFEPLARYAPGRVLDYLLLKHLFETRSASCVEYYTTASADDIRWATEQRPLIHLNCYSNRFVKGSVACVRHVAHALRVGARVSRSLVWGAFSVLPGDIAAGGIPDLGGALT